VLAQDLAVPGGTGAQAFGGLIVNPLGPSVATPANTIVVNFTDSDGTLGNSQAKGIPAGDVGSEFKYSNDLKTAGYKITTAKITTPFEDPNIVADLAATSSRGGSYNGAVTADPGDTDGNGSTPRAVAVAASFAGSTAMLASLVATVTSGCFLPLPAGPADPQSIPTLSGYALLALSLLMGVAVWRREKDEDRGGPNR
jgi:hypothetical protein